VGSLPLHVFPTDRAEEPAAPLNAGGRGLRRLIFVSRSRVPFNLHSPLDPLDGIIDASRARNDRLRITGLLVYNGRHFAQILEGEGRDIRAVFATIAHDPRHEDITVLENGAVAARSFAEWSVRYLDMADGTETEFQGEPTCEVALHSRRQAASLIALLRYCLHTSHWTHK